MNSMNFHLASALRNHRAGRLFRKIKTDSPPNSPVKKPRSAKQIEASRRNGRLSKGPISEAGKQKSSRNALKNGKFAVVHRKPTVFGLEPAIGDRLYRILHARYGCSCVDIQLEVAALASEISTQFVLRSRNQTLQQLGGDDTQGMRAFCRFMDYSILARLVQDAMSKIFSQPPTGGAKHEASKTLFNAIDGALYLDVSMQGDLASVFKLNAKVCYIKGMLQGERRLREICAKAAYGQLTRAQSDKLQLGLEELSRQVDAELAKLGAKPDAITYATTLRMDMR